MPSLISTNPAQFFLEHQEFKPFDNGAGYFDLSLQHDLSITTDEMLTYGEVLLKSQGATSSNDTTKNAAAVQALGNLIQKLPTEEQCQFLRQFCAFDTAALLNQFACPNEVSPNIPAPPQRTASQRSNKNGNYEPLIGRSK